MHNQTATLLKTNSVKYYLLQRLDTFSETLQLDTAGMQPRSSIILQVHPIGKGLLCRQFGLPLHACPRSGSAIGRGTSNRHSSKLLAPTSGQFQQSRHLFAAGVLQGPRLVLQVHSFGKCLLVL